MFSSKLVYENTDGAVEAVWALSNDGKTLTITSHYAAGALGDTDQKLIYEKQESGATLTHAKAPEFT